jgi:hypothetical protein
MTTEIIKSVPPVDVVKAEAGMKFTKFEIATDGTVGGTKILLNGKAIDDLNELSFSFYGGSYGGVNLTFCTCDKKNNPGEFVENHRFYLIPPIPDKADAKISTDQPSMAQVARADPNGPQTRKALLESM